MMGLTCPKCGGNNMPIAPKPLQVEVYCRDCGTYLEAQWSPMSSIKNDGSEAELSIEPCQCPLSEIKEVYEQFKHLDMVIGDRDVIGDSIIHQLAYDLWQAIKSANE